MDIFKSFLKKSATLIFTMTLLSSCSSNTPLSTSDLLFSVNSLQSSFLFSKNESTNAFYTAPEYAIPDSFSEVEVTFGSDEYKLPATLTLPSTNSGRRKFPVAILVHGSGPNDRDESFVNSKPFKDIAWGLASQGIAVLRYDKRTRVYSQKMEAISAGFTVKEEVTDDAIEAVKFIKENIDSYTNNSNVTTGKNNRNSNRKIFIIGHDLGGMLAPRISLQSSDVSGIAILAGNSQPLEDTLLYQLNNMKGLKEAEKQAFREQINNVKSLKNNSGNISSLPYNIPVKYWQDLNNYNQIETAKSLNIPILILQGENDSQINMSDFYAWQEALKNNPNAELESYQGLNHLFYEGDMIEESQKPQHVSEKIITDLNNWIKSN